MLLDGAVLPTATQAPRRRSGPHRSLRRIARSIDPRRGSDPSRRSRRQDARERNIPESTLRSWEHAHAKALADADGDPSADAFFRSPVGRDVLHRLWVAVLFGVTLCGAGGARLAARIFQLAGLARWIGASPASCQRAARAMTDRVADFGREESQRLATQGPTRKVTICEDETFHPQTCLVAMEPVSNFILLERYTEGRSSRAWKDAFSAATEGLRIEVVQGVGDAGKALTHHIAIDLGAHKGPDLFHVQYDVSRASAPVLAARLRAATRAHEDAVLALADVADAHAKALRSPRLPGRPIDWDARRRRACQALRDAACALEEAEHHRADMRAANRALGVAYHPYDLVTGAAREPAVVEAELRASFEEIWSIAGHASLPDSRWSTLRKAEAMIPAMTATLAFVQGLIAARTAALALPAAALACVRTLLIPGLYLARQAAQQVGREARATLRARSAELLQEAAASASWADVPTALRVQAESVARECAWLFTRSSACVEGRNGQLALHHHHLHRIPAKKLAALTTVHNYATFRDDRTTPASRFFGQSHRNLFEYLCEHMADPPHPRRTRPSGHAAREPDAAQG